MKKLYSFSFEYYRVGLFEGLFFAEEEDLNNVIGKDIYFGEIFGRHSELVQNFEREDFKVVALSQETLSELNSYFGDTISGYNPIDYIEDEDEEQLTTLKSYVIIII